MPTVSCRPCSGSVYASIRCFNTEQFRHLAVAQQARCPDASAIRRSHGRSPKSIRDASNPNVRPQATKTGRSGPHRAGRPRFSQRNCRRIRHRPRRSTARSSQFRGSRLCRIGMIEWGGNDIRGHSETLRGVGNEPWQPGDEREIKPITAGPYPHLDRFQILFDFLY
jgi:hypothetical protein